MADKDGNPHPQDVKDWARKETEKAKEGQGKK